VKITDLTLDGGDSSNVYTKTESDDRYVQKTEQTTQTAPDLSNYYNKTEVDEMFALLKAEAFPPYPIEYKSPIVSDFCFAMRIHDTEESRNRANNMFGVGQFDHEQIAGMIETRAKWYIDIDGRPPDQYKMPADFHPHISAEKTSPPHDWAESGLGNYYVFSFDKGAWDQASWNLYGSSKHTIRLVFTDYRTIVLKWVDVPVSGEDFDLSHIQVPCLVF
jgi:hypothetical protein